MADRQPRRVDDLTRFREHRSTRISARKIGEAQVLLSLSEAASGLCLIRQAGGDIFLQERGKTPWRKQKNRFKKVQWPPGYRPFRNWSTPWLR